MPSPALSAHNNFERAALALPMTNNEQLPPINDSLPPLHPNDTSLSTSNAPPHPNNVSLPPLSYNDAGLANNNITDALLFFSSSFKFSPPTKYQTKEIV